MPRIDLSVVTKDRPASLERLLHSVTTAHFLGDRASLAINLEQTADRVTHGYVSNFTWPHGTMTVRHRIILGGLMPAIVESWFPASNDSYGVLLEDDIEVSPLFYSWIKYGILRYRYTRQGRSRSARLYGISLYQQKAIELHMAGRKPFDAHELFDGLDIPANQPYLSQIPCSWGAVYFPETWREFHDYLALRLSEVAVDISDIVVPNIRSNRWPRSWKKYFIELVHLRGYSMLYPNYADWLSFSSNHVELGTHVHNKLGLPEAEFAEIQARRKVAFEQPLMSYEQAPILTSGLPNSRLPEWDALPVLDFWGALASEAELVARGWRDVGRLGTCGVRPLPPSFSSYDSRELLCPRSHQSRVIPA